MTFTDPIGDMFSRIRNGQMRSLNSIEIPSSSPVPVTVNLSPGVYPIPGLGILISFNINWTGIIPILLPSPEPSGMIEGLSPVPTGVSGVPGVVVVMILVAAIPGSVGGVGTKPPPIPVLIPTGGRSGIVILPSSGVSGVNVGGGGGGVVVFVIVGVGAVGGGGGGCGCCCLWSWCLCGCNCP